jgi:hypothetical protein
MKLQSVEQALSDEFAAYWHGDELPKFSNEDFFNQNASNAAIRLRQSIAENQIGPMKAYLESIRNNPDHPFLAELVNTTGIGWMDSPESWGRFQRVMDLIKQSF